MACYSTTYSLQHGLAQCITVQHTLSTGKQGTAHSRQSKQYGADVQHVIADMQTALPLARSCPALVNKPKSNFLRRQCSLRVSALTARLALSCLAHQSEAMLNRPGQS